MSIIAIAGIAIVAAVFSVMLKKYNPEYSIIISFAAGVLLLFLILSQISPAVSQINELIASTGIPEEYGKILFKSIGICFLAQFAADSCRDAGEGAMASKIELAGKIAIVLISLPLFESVATTATSLIGG